VTTCINRQSSRPPPKPVGRALNDGVVLLRLLTLDDVDEWLANEDEEHLRWFELPPATSESVHAAIVRWTESWETNGSRRSWGICEVRDGRLAGGVELNDLGDDSCNLSYTVFPFARRRGIATRAANIALGYAASEMGLSRAVVQVHQDNVASLGVARRLGAVPVGTQPFAGGGSEVIHHVDLAQLREDRWPNV
jgi:RimJ/RimL family protein N-acetyltransferase